MDIKTVKAIELVFDWNLWPRQSVQRLDSTNLSRMKTALKSGFKLPPVVANEKDYRIVDGFHRTKAVLAVFGDHADIQVDFRKYGNDSAMFLDAGTLNAYQGLTLSPKDRAHFILKCRKYKIPPAVVANALHINTEKMKKFIDERSAKTPAGEVIPLSAGARRLAGKRLTPAQEHFARTANGCLPEMYVSMLLNALKSDSVMLNEKTVGKLRELRNIIDSVLAEVA